MVGTAGRGVCNTPAPDQMVERARALLPALRARRRAYDEQACFPAENFADLRAAGLTAMTVPLELGGAGFWQDGRYSPFYEVLFTLAQADSCTAQLLQVHNHATGIIMGLGPEEQRRWVAREVAECGKLIASVGSEATPGAKEAEKYEATLRECPGGYLLSGRKAFASLAGGADYVLIWTAVPGKRSFNERLVFALLDRDQAGITLVNDWDVMGMRSTVSWSLILDDVFVPPERVIGRPGAWITDDPRTFTLAYTANHCGTAQGVYDAALSYVSERRHLAENQVVQYQLGELSSLLYGVRTAFRAAARLWDAGDHDAAEYDSLRALHLAKKVGIDVAVRVFDICGARASFRSYPLEQGLRDLRTFTLHFREEAYMQRVAQAALGGHFSSKSGRGGSTPPDQA